MFAQERRAGGLELFLLKWPGQGASGGRKSNQDVDLGARTSGLHVSWANQYEGEVPSTRSGEKDGNWECERQRGRQLRVA